MKKKTQGLSADHIGPISLGFKHDPLLLQKMSSSDNSAKRDRISIEDIEKLQTLVASSQKSIIISMLK